jgi:hypothetical protein
MRNLILASAACALIASAGASAQTFTFTTIDNPGDPTFNQLLGINDDGKIVGYFGSGQAGHPNIGYEISPPYTTYVPRMQPGSLQTQATGINNAGFITAFWSDSNSGISDNNFAVLFEPLKGGLASINVINPKTNAAPAVSQALGINNSNVVAGFYNDVYGVAHGITYTVGTATYAPIKIGGSTSVTATGINDNDEVCGFYSNAKNQTLGFVRSADGAVITTFRIPGQSTVQLFGLNNSGIAVGSYTDANLITHGVYYNSTNGAWIQVDDPNGIGGTVLNGLNNNNQIVGFYTDAAGNVHGMLVNVTP